MRWIAPALALTVTLALALAAPAAAEEVDLELVLLADASGSIDQSEIEFQRQGYATALTDPEVVRAITSNLTGSIAVTYVEWAANQAVVVDWMRIDGPAAAADFAARLLAPPRLAYGSNAIGAALIEGQRLIETNSFEGLRRVIDFSGDSANNRTGPALGPARDQVLAAGITINGLPILCWVCAGSAAGLRAAIWRGSMNSGSSAAPAPLSWPSTAPKALPPRSSAS